jgi:hypothetical protein
MTMHSRCRWWSARSRRCSRKQRASTCDSTHPPPPIRSIN